MFTLTSVIQAKFYLCLLVFARMAGAVHFAPAIGGRGVPGTVRVLGSVLLTVAIVPSLWYMPVANPGTLLAGAVGILLEFLVGLAAGTALLAFFAALGMCGDLVGRLGGFSVSASLDPSVGEEMPVLGVALRMLGTAVFILTGGLDGFVTGAIDSFSTLAPGTVLNLENAVTVLTGIVASSFVLALRLALPVFLSLLTLWIAAALLNRALPQLNMMTFTFSGNTLLTLAVLNLALAGILWEFQTRLPELLQKIQTLAGS